MFARTHGDFSVVKVTIASGESASPVVDIGGSLVVAIETPATMTGAGFEFKAARTLDGTLKDVFAEGTQVEIASAASRVVVPSAEDAEAVSACRFLQLISTDGAGTPAAEGAEREVWLWLKA